VPSDNRSRRSRTAGKWPVGSGETKLVESIIGDFTLQQMISFGKHLAFF